MKSCDPRRGYAGRYGTAGKDGFSMSDSQKRSEANMQKAKSGLFYLILCLCMVAVAAAAWSATVDLQQPEDTADLPGETIELSSDTPAQNAEVKVDSQPADASSAVSEPAVSESAAPADTPVLDEPDTVAHFFVMPVTGNILKKYNAEELQYSETYGDMRLHTGIDIEAPRDTLIKSAGNGVVEEVYADELYGNTVVINHGNGVYGYYCGLNNIPLVEAGDVVLSGTELGSLADIPCESADASHFHFAMKKDGAWVSPLEMMNME